MLNHVPRSVRPIVGLALLAAGWAAVADTSFAQSYALPQPVAGAQRGVVRYREGLFGRVRYKSRYGNGITDNGVAVFGQFFDAAKTLVPVILDATSPLPSGSGGSIPKTSGGEGRTGEVRSGGVAATSLDDDLRALGEMQTLNARFEALRAEYGLPPRTRTGAEAQPGDEAQPSDEAQPPGDVRLTPTTDGSLAGVSARSVSH